MRSRCIVLSILTQLSHALPQPTSAACSTTTLELIVPTTTVTYTTTPISTIYATTAEDLGTFTSTVRIPATSTVATVTSTASSCANNSANAAGAFTIDRYDAAQAAAPLRPKRDDGAAEPACVVTSTWTTSVGQTYVFVAGPSTRLYTQYTAFRQATVTVTAYTGTSYVVASATASCAPPAPAPALFDPRCAPAAMVSAAGGRNNTQYGLAWKADVPTAGAVYRTTTPDASACCQLCAGQAPAVCAGSAWDARTGACALEFAVDPADGALDCGESLLAYYDAGPRQPMAPGAGWWVADVCGRAQYGSAEPDDGSK